jgi:sulfate transport system permease protein
MKTRPSLLPGFGLSLGYTTTYLGILVVLPLCALLLKAAGLSGDVWQATLLHPQVLAAFKISLLTAFAAALLNGVFGFLVAWVLVRYRFPGRAWLDGLVDIPFALPTAVAGIALTAVYSPQGPLGKFLALFGLQVAYTPLGISLALAFIGLPFVVRTLQPVLEEMDPEIEEAAACMGANAKQTFWWVLFPPLIPPLLTGFALAFARGLGEYGSVVFISGNLPYRTEIVPLIIAGKLERFDYAGATAVATAMLALSFTLMLAINLLQRWAGIRQGVK